MVKVGDKVTWCGSTWFVAGVGESTVAIEQLRHYSDGDSIAVTTVPIEEVSPA